MVALWTMLLELGSEIHFFCAHRQLSSEGEHGETGTDAHEAHAVARAVLKQTVQQGLVEILKIRLLDWRIRRTCSRKRSTRGC